MPGRRIIALLGVTAVLLAAGFAESPAEAKFLRNGVRPGATSAKALFLRAPSPGAPVRIRPPGEAPAGAPPAAARATARHDWFWAAYAPTDPADAGRWGRALALMQDRRARGLGLIPLATVQKVRALWGPQIAAAAAAHHVSDALLLAVIAVESAGRPGAISPKGAQGLMQLIPATATRFGVADAFDPGGNIGGGAAYLDWLLAEFDGDVLLALAGYNAGEGAVIRHGGVPPYAETRNYVVLVLDALAAAGGLCDAPPAGPRRPCSWKPET